jgi:hypothetical protein
MMQALLKRSMPLSLCDELPGSLAIFPAILRPLHLTEINALLFRSAIKTHETPF